MTCEICNGTGFVIIERNGISAAKRCEGCRKPAVPNVPISPVSSAVATAATVALCEVLEFSPTSELARMLISNALISMCPNEEAVWHVVSEAAQLYRNWGKCGIPGLRQIVCCKYSPRDGISLTSTDEYPDGLPSRRQLELVLAPAHLPPGHESTADRKLEDGLQNLAQKKRLQ